MALRGAPPAEELSPACPTCGEAMLLLPPDEATAALDAAADWACLDCEAAPDGAGPPEFLGFGDGLETLVEGDEGELDRHLDRQDIAAELDHVCPECGAFTENQVSPREPILFWKCGDCRAEGEEPVTESEADRLRPPPEE